MNGESAAITRITGDLFHRVRDASARIGNVVDLLAEFLGERFAGVRNLMMQLVARGQLREIRVRHRVALKVDQSGILHLVNLFPCQIVRVDAREIVDEKDRRLESIFFQDRIGVLVVVDIAVVEGNDDRLFGERRAVFRRVHHLIQRDRMVALFCEICHLLIELVAV